jgi:hypothetical protein
LFAVCSCAALSAAALPAVSPGTIAAVQAQTSKDAGPTPDDGDFAALLARVKQSDPAVDFTRLRRLYARSPQHKPYPDADQGAMLAAASRGDLPAALTLARAILGRDYMNVVAHMAADVACRAAGDWACAAHHFYVAQGLLTSIRASGNGRTPTTAYIVVTRGEEMAITQALGVTVREQTLLQSPEGHAIDVLTGTDGAGDDRQVFFNVDLLLATLNRPPGAP